MVHEQANIVLGHIRFEIIIKINPLLDKIFQKRIYNRETHIAIPMLFPSS